MLLQKLAKAAFKIECYATSYVVREASSALSELWRCSTSSSSSSLARNLCSPAKTFFNTTAPELKLNVFACNILLANCASWGSKLFWVLALSNCKHSYTVQEASSCVNEFGMMPKTKLSPFSVVFANCCEVEVSSCGIVASPWLSRELRLVKLYWQML